MRLQRWPFVWSCIGPDELCVSLGHITQHGPGGESGGEGEGEGSEVEGESSESEGEGGHKRGRAGRTSEGRASGEHHVDHVDGARLAPFFFWLVRKFRKPAVAFF